MNVFKNSRVFRGFVYATGGTAALAASGGYLIGNENVRYLPAGCLRFGRAAVTVSYILL